MNDDASDPRWLSLPEVAELLDIRLRDVRGLLRDQSLAGTRPTGGAFLVPVEFLLTRDDGAAEPGPLPSLRGTLIQLTDSGLSTDDAVEWLLEEQEELGCSPVTALRERRIHEVRRLAQTAGF